MPHRAHPIRAWRLPETAPVPTGQAALVEAAVDRTLVRTLGALPLLLPLFEQLGLREMINRRCHPADATTRDLDLGLVTVVLVLNRLLAPQPLVHVETWLATTVLPDLLGLDAAQCNDDRLARALDALVPHLDALWQDLIVAAIVQFDVDLRQLCYDITSISFCGDYEEAELITYGYSRDHRPDRKQIEVASTVTGADGVPLDYRVLAGAVADRTTPVDNLHRLQALLALLPARPAGEEPLCPLVISDRAMLTEEALAAYADSAWHYLGPLDPSIGDGAVRALLASVPADELAAAPLAYRPQRAERDPTWEDYHGVLRPLMVPHPDQERPPLQLRALVVWSPGKARLDAQLRATHLRRLEQAFSDLHGKLGRRPYTTVAAVHTRVATLLRRHPARSFLTVQVTQEAGRPQAVTCTYNTEALTAAAAVDGRYVLGTNDPALPADAMLALAKRRDVPEKRFALVKGPLAIRPLYVQKQERVLGLVFCTMVALLVFSLLELQARRAAVPLSGTALLEHCAALGVLILVLKDGSTLRLLTGVTPPVSALLHALGGPPVEHYLKVPT
jgi:transposase